MSNIYYDPGAFGLTVVGEVDTGGAYEFDMFVVWKNDAGQLFWQTDAGCSCPTPFEDYNLSNVCRGTAEEATKDALEWVSDSYRKDQLADVHTLIRKINA